MRQRGVQIGTPFKVPSYLAHPLVVPSIRFHTLVSNAYDAPSLCSVAFHSIAPSHRKMSWYPHAIKLLQAINLHSRGPTDQHLYVLEPHRGCLHNLKKVSWYPLIKEGQQSHKYAFWRANEAIKMENVLVPPCSILLVLFSL